MTLLYWASIVAITCARIHTEACLPGQERFGDSCYHLLAGKMTWGQGDAACSEMGAALTVPDSAEEHRFIWEMFTANVAEGSLWIGCHDRETEGKWVKSGEGGDCNFFNWAPGEPRGWGDCMQLWRDGNGLMDDTSCDVFQISVVCESLVPLAVPNVSCLQSYADARSPSHCLTGHVIGEFPVRGVVACGSACRDEPRCRSFNLRRGGPGEVTCQLNSIARHEADEQNIRLDHSCKYFNF